MSTRRSSPILVGRDDELRLLEEAVAERGVRPVILLGGEAGIGKSRLVVELTARAEESGAIAVVGSCLELGADDLPYAPFVDALGRLMDALGDRAEAVVGASGAEMAMLVPDIVPIDATGAPVSRGRMYEAVRSLLDGMPTPLVMVLEDVHWADRSSLELLAYLASRLRHGRVAIVATFRTDELHRRHRLVGVLAELTRSGRAMRLDLTRLDGGQVARLIQAIRADVPIPLIEAIAIRSDGNPFLVEELLAADYSSDPSMPSTLRDLLLAGLGTLPDASRRVVDLVATVGRPAETALLEAAWDESPTELDGAIRGALDGAILVVEPASDRLAFRHALIGEAVAGDLLPSERFRLHAILARVLAERPDLASATPAAAAAEIAHHLFEARDLPAALVASVRAAEDAVTARAYPEARDLYERALELLERVPKAAEHPGIERIRLLDAAAESSFHAGDARRAVDLGRRALAAAEGTVEDVVLGHLVGRLLEWTAMLGDAEDLIALGERSVRLVPAEPPTVERAFALLSLATALSLVGRHHAALVLARESAAVALACQAVANEANAHAAIAVSLRGLGRDREAIDESDRAVALADRSRGSVEVGVAHTTRPAVYSVAGRFGDLPQVLAQARVALDREGLHDMSEPFLVTDEVDLLAWQGRWNEAIDLASRTIDAAPARLPLGDLLVSRGQLLVRRGRLDEGLRDLQAAIGIRPPIEPAIRARATAGMAEAALVRRDPPEALLEIDDGLAILEPTDELPGRAHLLALGLRASGDLTERGRARRDATATADATAKAGSYAAGLHALVADHSIDGGAPGERVTSRIAWGDAEERRHAGVADPESWAAAAAALSAAGEPYFSAGCRFREAEAVLSAAGDRRLAETVLQEIRGWARSVDAKPLLLEIDALARRARLDLADLPQPPELGMQTEGPADAGANPYGLSPREQEVLALLVEGRTNREIGEALFISEKTASSHVTHILDKLGVTSRGAAAAVAVRGGLVGGP